MVKIKLTSVGVKHKLSYRIIVAEARSKLDGKAIEIIGYHDPKTKPPITKIKKDRYEFWLAKGARPTLTVQKLVEKHG